MKKILTCLVCTLLIWIEFFDVSETPVTTEQVVNMVKPCTVQIMVDGGWGSGVFIGPNLIVTARHVVDGYLDALYIKGIVVEGVYKDEFLDVAFIKVSGQRKKFVRFDQDRPIVGEFVLVVGTPAEEYLYNSVTCGVVSGVNRKIEFFNCPWILQIDASVNPGDSGGPVVDLKGRLLGIVVGGNNQWQELNFVLPVKFIKEALERSRNAF